MKLQVAIIDFEKANFTVQLLRNYSYYYYLLNITILMKLILITYIMTQTAIKYSKLNHLHEIILKYYSIFTKLSCIQCDVRYIV